MTDDKRYRDKDWLKQKYIDEDFTQEEIGDMCDTTRKTISHWLYKHNILTSHESRSDIHDSKQFSDSWLKAMYFQQQLSVIEIADETSLSAQRIGKLLGEVGITTKSDEYKHHNEEWLYDKYVNDGMTVTEIAELCGVCRNSIYSSIYRNDLIEDEHMYKYKKYNSKDWLEKKYCNENMTAQEISDVCDVAHTTIYNHLKDNDIL